MPERDHVCKVNIKIDGKTFIQGKEGKYETKDGWYVEYLQVDKRVDCPDLFSIELQIVQDVKLIILDDLREGKSIEISLGFNELKSVMKGEISYIEPYFRTKGGSRVTVRGYDHCHRLTRGTDSKTWGDGIQQQDLYSSAINDVISKAGAFGGNPVDGLQTDKVEAPAVKYKYIPQLNISNYHFLKYLGQDMDKKTDADTVQDDKKISFYKVDTKQQAVFYLCREKFEQGKESQSRLIKEARFSLSTVRQYKRVEVRGWDPKKKKNIVGFAEESDYDFGGTPGWKATGKALYGSDADGKVFTVVDHPVESKEEADAIAKAIFNQLSLDFITGEVDIEGEPEVVPGNIIELCQFGERFSGKYLITGLTHIVSPSGEGYRTRINFVSNNIMKV